jgi:hypothetical protein
MDDLEYDISHYELFLLLEEPSKPSFEFQSSYTEISKFISEATTDDELTIFLIRDINKIIQKPNWGDAKHMLRQAISADLVLMDIEPYCVDGIWFGIGSIRKEKQSTKIRKRIKNK